MGIRRFFQYLFSTDSSEVVTLPKPPVVNPENVRSPEAPQAAETRALQNGFYEAIATLSRNSAESRNMIASGAVTYRETMGLRQ